MENDAHDWIFDVKIKGEDQIEEPRQEAPEEGNLGDGDFGNLGDREQEREEGPWVSKTYEETFAREIENLGIERIKKKPQRYAESPRNRKKKQSEARHKKKRQTQNEDERRRQGEDEQQLQSEELKELTSEKGEGSN